MTKILVSMDEKLVERVDREARRLAARELGEVKGPGSDPKVRQAIADLRRLFAENPHPGDPTEIIRKMRDSR